MTTTSLYSARLIYVVGEGLRYWRRDIYRAERTEIARLIRKERALIYAKN